MFARVHRTPTYFFTGALTKKIGRFELAHQGHVIERAVIHCSGPTLEVGHEALSVTSATLTTPERLMTLEEAERSHILRVLELTKWVIGGPKGAAERLNIHPNTLRSRLPKLGIKKPE